MRTQRKICYRFNKFDGFEEIEFLGLMEYGRPSLEKIGPYRCNRFLILFFALLLAI